MKIKIYGGGTLTIPTKPGVKKWTALVIFIEPGRLRPHSVFTLDEYYSVVQTEEDRSVEECTIEQLDKEERRGMRNKYE